MVKTPRSSGTFPQAPKCPGLACEWGEKAATAPSAHIPVARAAGSAVSNEPFLISRIWCPLQGAQPKRRGHKQQLPFVGGQSWPPLRWAWALDFAWHHQAQMSWGCPHVPTAVFWSHCPACLSRGQGTGTRVAPPSPACGPMWAAGHSGQLCSWQGQECAD